MVIITTQMRINVRIIEYKKKRRETLDSTTLRFYQLQIEKLSFEVQ